LTKIEFLEEFLNRVDKFMKRLNKRGVSSEA
jgi:hypothetical protein